MKIAALADLHGHFPPVEALGDPDVVVIAGDIVAMDFEDHGGLRGQYIGFRDWLDEVWGAGILPIGIAGNHDFAFREIPEMPYKFKWIYLEDSAYRWKGINFYGSPWQRWFGGWAYNAPEFDQGEEFLSEKFQKIPNDTDVLITHSPPVGFHDRVGRKNVGSVALNRRVQEVGPKLHVYGHIHRPGVEQTEGVTLCNAAYTEIKDYAYVPFGNPIPTFEI
jgi:Icc-related predicted phosphoesterase